MTKNPLNDEHYDGNDDQIADLKEAVEELTGQLHDTTESLVNMLVHFRDRLPEGDRVQRDKVVDKSRALLDTYSQDDEEDR
jgi:hypothetical protein